MSGVAAQTIPVDLPPSRFSQYDGVLSKIGVTCWDYIAAKGTLDISTDFVVAYGYNPNEIFPFTPEKWRRLVHPDDSIVLFQFERMIKGEANSIDTVFRTKTASGEWRYFHIRGSVVETDSVDNQVVRISGTFQDITDLKIADLSLQRRDQLLAAVNISASILLSAEPDEFDQAIDQVLHFIGTAAGVDRVYIWQNEVIDGDLYCSQIYEWSPLAAPQQGSELTVNIRYKESMPTWVETLAAGECINNIVRNMPQTEQDQLVPQGITSILVAPVLLRDKFWGFIGVDDCHNERIWDNAEAGILKSAGSLLASTIQRQKTEIALSQERRALDWILESSPIAVITSEDGKVHRLNKRGRELFAVSEGTPLEELHTKIQGKYQDCVNSDLIFKEIVEKDFFIRSDIQYPCTDGKLHDFTLISLLQEPKNFQKTISWLVDISDLKETERELIQARNKAEVATKAKSEFLARMSHEIRTPMNAILGLLYLCLQTELSDKQQDYLTKSQSAANNLLGIINDILDISKIESGKFELESIPFSLKKTVEEVIDIVRPGAEGKGLRIITKIDPDINDSLLGDSLRLRQILLNLVNNAIKFTAKGGIFVTVNLDDKWLHYDTEKYRLAFEVKDTGIGLQEDQIENIFESFAQADGSTTRKYGGTGLGLAIVKNLVELMEGRVYVSSTFGQGSTFRFTAVFAQSCSEPDMSSAVLLNKRRVLIVDDDAHDLEIMRNLVQSLRMDVMAVHTGEAALEKLEEATLLRVPFELVIIDWRMPRMDGIETVRCIRQNVRISPPYILMISAYDRQECLRHVQGLNVSGVLSKPVHPKVLKETLKVTFREDLTRKTGESRADIRGSKVLLAEDNKINQLVASELLCMMNVDVTIANNGIEAVEAVKKQDFDLILMDIQMPEMDGLTAVQIIRNLEKPEIDKLPILAMTANALDTDYQRSLAVGMNDHLTKPIDPEKLRLALEKWIVRSESQERVYGFASGST